VEIVLQKAREKFPEAKPGKKRGRGSLLEKGTVTGTAFGVNLFACPDTPDVVQQEPAFM
jgi:hypothetical protein